MLRIARAVRAMKQAPVERQANVPYLTSRTCNSLTVEWVFSKEMTESQCDALMAQLDICDPDSLKWTTAYKGSSCIHTIAHLSPNTVYKLRLRVDATQMIGDWSEPITVYTQDDSISPRHLFRAIKYGYHQEVANILQERSSEGTSHIYNEAGLTPLQLAVALGDKRMAEIILGPKTFDVESTTKSKGCDVNAVSCQTGERTALMIACTEGHEELIQLLDSRGARWDQRDSNGATALHYAVDASQAVAVRIALEAAPELIESQDSCGWTPLLRGVIIGSSTAVLDDMLTEGANANHRDQDGLSCLAAAVITLNVPVICVLLAHGGLAHLPGDCQDNTPVQIARDILGNEEMLDILEPPVHPMICTPPLVIDIDSNDDENNEALEY